MGKKLTSFFVIAFASSNTICWKKYFTRKIYTINFDILFNKIFFKTTCCHFLTSDSVWRWDNSIICGVCLARVDIVLTFHRGKLSCVLMLSGNLTLKIEKVRRTPIDRIADWQNGVSVNLHWKHLTLDWPKVTSPEKFGQSSLQGSSWPKSRWLNGAPAYWLKKVPN